MFDRQAYIDNLLDHYENPRNRRPMPDATVSLRGGNPGCGDIVTLYLKLDGDEQIVDVSFEGEGCTISQAAASILTELIKDHTLEEVKNWDLDEFIDTIGREVVINRPKCATLALNTAKAAERKYRARQAEGAAPESPDDNEVIDF